MQFNASVNAMIIMTCCAAAVVQQVFRMEGWSHYIGTSGAILAANE